ncbi:hypothetical protein B0H13DRAFT_2287014 [Mycena leptocephala]|nr:hypothetical protein B0H13DRAFT_2287014 [Mycena leptocephala]
MVAFLSVFTSSQVVGLSAAGFFLSSTTNVSPFNLIPIIERSNVITPATRAPLYKHMFFSRGRPAFIGTAIGGGAAFLVAYFNRPADISQAHSRALLAAAGSLLLAVPHTVIWVLPIYKELAKPGRKCNWPKHAAVATGPTRPDADQISMGLISASFGVAPPPPPLLHRFPNELWLEVIAQLPSDALRDLSSTHRVLYDIARSLGFTEFKLYSYPYEFQPPKAQIDDALERLSFYSSPKIAPHRWQWSAQSDDEGSPHILMNAFFECLPQFTGLQRLYADRIQFTQMGLANLCELPALAYVELSGCTVAAGEHINPGSMTLGVAKFITRYDYDMNDLWLSLLSRDSLRELNFSDLSALNKPGVLLFRTKLLTELRGITALPNIVSLTVRFITSSENVFGEAEVNKLFTLFPHLAELQLTLYPDAEDGGGFIPQPTSFLKMLAANALLPNTLQSLSLDWDFPFEYGSTDSAKGNDPAPPSRADIPDFAGLREELIAKCARLTWIFLDGYHFLFWWRKLEWDGTVREATAYSYDDAEHLRAQKTQLKYGPSILIS